MVEGSGPMIDAVCSNCGSDRLGAIQRGIDNWPVAQCFDCGPRASVIPEEEGPKRTKAIQAAAKRPIGSKKAIHTVLRPVVERSAYRPGSSRPITQTVSMWDED